MAQMVKHEWQVGQMTIVVFAPEGIDVTRASVTVDNRDRAQFLRSAEAVGGLDALSLPRTQEPYSQAATAYTRREDGSADTRVYVALEEPADVRVKTQARVRPPHPFFVPLAERRERERSPTASTEETRAKGPGPVAAGEEFPRAETSI